MQKKRAVEVDRPASAKGFALLWIRAAGSAGSAAYLDFILHFFPARVFLRDADCFFAVLRRVCTAGQFDALVSRVYGDAGEIRILLEGRLNLAGIATRSLVTLRHSRSGTAA